VIHVVERLIGDPQLDERVCGIVVASIRPSAGLLLGDLDRWVEVDLIADDAGVQLIDWVIIGPLGPVVPREILGEPSRW
jgi:hypothetical protein